MTLGVCYYPEHWPESRWRTDAEMMRESGLRIVRIAEFAWAKMEPREGEFAWGWLDQAVDVLSNAGLQVVLGTPTASPPAWLARAYPETLPVDASGRRMEFGMRRHYCPTNLAFRGQTRRIVTAMAERYGRRMDVVGWQIDNEWGGGKTVRCYCQHCADAFRTWLRRCYGTLDTLNEAWGTVFWSQCYTDWDQIGLPPDVYGKVNPSQALDFDRFTSDTWVSYQQLQVDLLRERIADHQFITTNFMGLFPDLDYYDLAQPLDFVTWDNYPTGHTERMRDRLYYQGLPKTEAYAHDAGDPAITGMAHDLMRSLKDGPFWVMEQQPGYINWADYNPTPAPGVVRLWTWDAIAHGANTVVYFRWRACRVAQEQFHSGLLRHDGRVDQGLLDVQSMREEQTLMAEIEGTRVAAEVALLYSYDDHWALSLQRHNRDFDYQRHLFTYYRALQGAGVPVDLAPATRNLERYRLVIAPTLFLVDEGIVANLRRYVEGGGRLLLSVRSGFKTASNLVVGVPLPGLLAPLVGASVDRWYSLPPGLAVPLSFVRDPHQVVAVPLWAETLQPGDAEAVATFAGGLFDGRVAATVHRLGDGEVLYLGAWATDELLDTMLPWLLSRAGVTRLAQTPAGVKALRRVGNGHDFIFLLNFTGQDGQAILLDRDYLDAFTGQPIGTSLIVPARGVRICRREEPELPGSGSAM